MISTINKKKYYQAFIQKDPQYEGIFFVGVKSTGIFCRPTCPARKPKIEHCEFFETSEQALLAAYRPCHRCQPLSYPNHASKLIQTLLEAIEQCPEKRWKDQDFLELSVDASTVRRQFKKRFGMTFVQYARAKRMGLAIKQIEGGEKIIDAQLSVGYESSSGFREAFTRIIGKAPTLLGSRLILKASWLDTPLGPLLAIADEEALHLLEFGDRRDLEHQVERLKKRTEAIVIPGVTPAITSVEKELHSYFSGQLKTFQTPLFLLGSPFQKKVWDELKKIPFGETRSYGDLAQSIGQPSAYRAVALANRANSFAIVIPCHRVIKTNGDLCGYSGGLARKKWLLNHEKVIPNVIQKLEF